MKRQTKNLKIFSYDLTLEKQSFSNETGFYLNMTKHLGRCEKGRKCYKTVYKYPFVKWNFVLFCMCYKIWKNYRL